MKIFKNEIGRSMVEMLGVLAIIGVLSIGAIAGYKYAMTKAELNTLLNGLSQARIVMETAINTGNKTVYLTDNGGICNESYKILEGYGLEEYGPAGVVCSGDDSFDIILEGISTNLCNAVINETGRGGFFVASVRTKGSSSYDRACLDLHNLNTTCHDGDDLRMAFSFVIGDDTADILKPCETSSDCAGGNCVNGQCERTQCSTEKPLKSNGACYPCNTTKIIKTTEDACAVCSSERFYDSDGGVCVKNGNDCAGVLTDWGGCYSCDDKYDLWDTTKEQCEACSEFGRTYDASQNVCRYKCSDNEMRDSDYGCLPCDYSYTAWYVSREDCLACGRHMSDEGYCVPKCDGNKFYSSDRGGCISCSDMQTSEWSIDEADCKRCGRVLSPWRSCSSPCVEDNTFMSGEGICYSCGESTAIYTSQEECNKCSNERTQMGSYCAKKCAENSFMATDNKCYSCEEPLGKNSTAEECNKCSELREYESGKCYLKTCPDGSLPRDAAKGCYDCSYTGTITYATAAEANAAYNSCKGSGTPRLASGTGSYPCSTTNYVMWNTYGLPDSCDACTAVGSPRIASVSGLCVPCFSSVYWTTKAYASDQVTKCAKLGVTGFYYSSTGTTGYTSYYPCTYSGSLSFTTEALAQGCASQCPGIREAVGTTCRLIQN